MDQSEFELLQETRQRMEGKGLSKRLHIATGLHLQSPLMRACTGGVRVRICMKINSLTLYVQDEDTSIRSTPSKSTITSS